MQAKKPSRERKPKPTNPKRRATDKLHSILDLKKSLLTLEKQLPSMKDSPLALKYVKILGSPHLSPSEIAIEAIKLLKQFHPHLKSLKEKQIVNDLIKRFETLSAEFSFIPEKLKKRKNP